MLMLTRKKREYFTITTPSGDRLTIVYVKPSRGGIQLGIDAPAGYKITRPESERKNEQP